MGLSLDAKPFNFYYEHDGVPHVFHMHAMSESDAIAHWKSIQSASIIISTGEDCHANRKLH